MTNELREIIESKLKLIEAEAKNLLGGIEFPFVKTETINNNKRFYPADVVSKEIVRKNEEIKKSGVAGQLNHPKINATELDKISHVVTSLEYDEKSKLGKAKAMILNTSKGRDLMTLIKSGIQFGASMRGFGTTDSRGVVNSGWRLGTIDLVENPSFGSQTMITKSNLLESGNQILTDYEDKMKKKNKGGLTLDDIKKLRPDLLEQHKEEILIEEEALLYRRFVVAQEADYKGTFEQFKEMAKNYKPEELDESSLSQRKQDELKFEREKEKKAELLKEDYQRYDDAVTGGYNGSFKDFQKLIKEGKQKLELKEARSSIDPIYAAAHAKEGLWPHELQQAAKLEQELLRKAEVKRYLEDVEKGLWLGSFREWQLDKREQLRKVHLGKRSLDFTYPR